MLQLIKLYSDTNKFKEIDFKPGINLILGSESTDDGSVLVSSRKMNGVGKSLVIELINFCLLKKRDQSRIFSLPDSVMPKNEYINLHFKVDQEHYIFSRNKKGDIKIKSGGEGEFIKYEELDAKSYLRTILSLNDLDLSAREYLNFLIKEEDYNYSKFAELYRSNDYASLLRVHFFFYGLPMQILTSIRSSFEEHNEATKLIKKIKDGLSVEGIDFKELESKKNQYDYDIRQMESDLKYDKIMENLGEKKKDFIKVENEINSLLTERSVLQIELDEINGFSNLFSDDIYIDDNDLQIVFNKYSQGLGDIVKKDIEALKIFRDQLINFNNDFLNTKKKDLESGILALSKKINFLYSQIDDSSKVTISDTASSVISNFRIYREKNSQFEHYNKLMEEKEMAESEKKRSKYTFTDYIKKLDDFKADHRDVFDSLNKDFVEIHKKIMGNAECSFQVVINDTFKPKSFFKFEVSIEGKGSKGINQASAVIYDLVLLSNCNTKDRHVGLIIHDNLIFGTVDSDTSAKVLNYLNTLPADSFQYIATVNVDDFSYCEQHQLFEEDYRSKNVIIELTKTDPLFSRQWSHKEK